MAKIAYSKSEIDLSTQQVKHRTIVTASGVDANDIEALRADLIKVAGDLTLVSERQGASFTFDPNDLMVDALKPGVSVQQAELVSKLHDAVVADFQMLDAGNGAVAAVIASKEFKDARKRLPDGEKGDVIAARLVKDMVGYSQRAGTVRAENLAKSYLGG